MTALLCKAVFMWATISVSYTHLEELGLVGAALVLILFGILIWKGYRIAQEAPDMFGTLMAAGITSLVAIQVAVNVAVVTSSVPVTGMALPFFSYGGTSLMILLS